MDESINSVLPLMRDDGVLIYIIGDVAKSKNSVISPARNLLSHLLESGNFGYIGFMSDYLDVNSKTSRIWGESKGNATTVDRIILLSPSKLKDSSAFKDLSGYSFSELSEAAIHFAGM